MTSPTKRTPPWLRDISLQRLEICQALLFVEAELYNSYGDNDSEVIC